MFGLLSTLKAITQVNNLLVLELSLSGWMNTSEGLKVYSNSVLSFKSCSPNDMRTLYALSVVSLKSQELRNEKDSYSNEIAVLIIYKTHFKSYLSDKCL